MCHQQPVWWTEQLGVCRSGTRQNRSNGAHGEASRHGLTKSLTMPPGNTSPACLTVHGIDYSKRSLDTANINHLSSKDTI